MEGGKNRYMGRGVSTSERREKGQPSLRGIQIILRAGTYRASWKGQKMG